MSDINETLEQRGKTYGDFKDVAWLSQELQVTMQRSKNWALLRAEQREALQTISSKIARILNGEPDHADSWHGIAGYAQLIEKEVKGRKTKQQEVAAWEEGERRMEDIGRNSNEGEHYDYLLVPEHMTIPDEVRFIRVHESGFATGYNQHLTADASLSVLATAHELGEVGREQQGDYVFHGEHWLRV